MIKIKEKDLKILGIKHIELDTKGNIIRIVAISGKIDKPFNWRVLGLDYCGG